MKKLLTVLVVLSLVCMTMVSLAEENAFVFRNGVQFTQNMDQVIETETGRYEIDQDRVRGGVTFYELEYEKVTEDGVPADLTYLFVGNELVAIRVDYNDRAISYDQAKAALADKYGEFGALDTQKLGSGIYAVDDDGRPERGAECCVAGNVMIVIEQDEDGDVDVTYVDLNAEYVHM